MPLNGLEDPVRRGTRHHDDGRTETQRVDQENGNAIGKCEGRGTADDVVRFHRVHARITVTDRDDVAVKVQGGFRVAGRSRSKSDQCRVIGRGPDCAKPAGLLLDIAIEIGDMRLGIAEWREYGDPLEILRGLRRGFQVIRKRFLAKREANAHAVQDEHQLIGFQ